MTVTPLGAAAGRSPGVSDSRITGAWNETTRPGHPYRERVGLRRVCDAVFGVRCRCGRAREAPAESEPRSAVERLHQPVLLSPEGPVASGARRTASARARAWSELYLYTGATAPGESV